MSKTYFGRGLFLGKTAVYIYIAISVLIVFASEFVVSDDPYWKSQKDVSTVIFMLLYIPIVIGVARNWIWAWLWALLLIAIDATSSSFIFGQHLLALALAVLFCATLVGAVACYQYNQRYKQERKLGQSLLGIVGVAVAAILLVLFSVNLLTDPITRLVPGLQQGDALPPDARDELVTAGVLEADETIDQFFFCSSVSYLDCGSVLTDGRAVSYRQIEGRRQIDALPYASITDVNLWEKGSWLTPSRIEVIGQDQRLVFFMPALENADVKFIARLKDLAPKID